ncbi:MAG: hypothetical protein DWI21_01270 [Planctomycetota bacterium]|nr:MAG: hypothetical protein DWI21_01270 [Planctomycetota bacterium]
MSRCLRIEIPGGVDHVLNRGVDRADIVRDDEDRHEWFRLFNRVATRCDRVAGVEHRRGFVGTNEKSRRD